MFAEIAPRVRERGWSAIIPIIAGQKRPAISAWNACNFAPPTDAEIACWGKIYPEYSIGLAFGPDEVIGIDLDWTDPDLAQRACDVTKDTLGETPLLRVGRPPKRLALFRSAPGLVVDGKAFNGFEIFSRSGQCVLFGVHPQTGQPYRWLTDSPMTIAPGGLPIVRSEQIVALIDGLQQLDPVTTARQRACVRGYKKSGITTDILRALQDVEDAPAEAARILTAAPPGKRHNTKVGAAIALAMRGYSDAAIFDALKPVYCALMDDLSIEEAIEEIRSAVRWAREREGPDDAAITQIMAPAMEGIASAWNWRWGRR